jgi:Putative prokaryotic signal transducing protein
MTDDLVTAAVFGDQTQAVVVRMHLEEAGIPAFLLDELMSQGLFVIGGATGGIRVQVPASRLQEAVRLINDRLPEHAVPVDWSEVDVGQPEAEEAVEDEEILPEPSAAPTAPAVEAVVETEPLDRTLREQRADRIVRGALIGLFAWPVYFLAVWRLVQIASSKERLRPEYQRKANIGAIIVGIPLLLLLSFFCCVPTYWLAVRVGF